MSNERPASICGLCGEPMPPGEEMFNYHGFSGPCPSKKDALQIDVNRDLNPMITFLKIIIPEGPLFSPAKVLSCQDKDGKEIGFIQEIDIHLSVNQKVPTCKGKRALIMKTQEPQSPGAARVSQPMVNQKGEIMTEEFACPCVLEVIR